MSASAVAVEQDRDRVSIWVRTDHEDTAGTLVAVPRMVNDKGVLMTQVSQKQTWSTEMQHLRGMLEIQRVATATMLRC